MWPWIHYARWDPSFGPQPHIPTRMDPGFGPPSHRPHYRQHHHNPFPPVHWHPQYGPRAPSPWPQPANFGPRRVVDDPSARPPFEPYRRGHVGFPTQYDREIEQLEQQEYLMPDWGRVYPSWPPARSRTTPPRVRGGSHVDDVPRRDFHHTDRRDIDMGLRLAQFQQQQALSNLIQKLQEELRDMSIQRREDQDRRREDQVREAIEEIRRSDRERRAREREHQRRQRLSLLAPNITRSTYHGGNRDTSSRRASRGAPDERARSSRRRVLGTGPGLFPVQEESVVDSDDAPAGREDVADDAPSSDAEYDRTQPIISPASPATDEGRTGYGSGPQATDGPSRLRYRQPTVTEVPDEGEYGSLHDSGSAEAGDRLHWAGSRYEDQVDDTARYIATSRAAAADSNSSPTQQRRHGSGGSRSARRDERDGEGGGLRFRGS